MSLCFEITAPQSLVPITTADNEWICLAPRSVQSPSPSPHLQVTEQNPGDKAGMSALLSPVCDCGASKDMSLSPGEVGPSGLGRVGVRGGSLGSGPM